MKTKTKIFENINYVTGLINNNRNIEEGSLNKICEHVIDLFSDDGNGRGSFIDLGCGTGRFSIPIAQRDQMIDISCLDSSRNMLDLLRNSIRRFRIENIEVIHECIENFQTSLKYNVVFISAVIHLLEDKRATFHRVGSLQNKGGYFVLRTPFRDQIEHVDIYRWIPEALEIYRKSHPTKDDVYNMARDSGYTVEGIEPFTDTKYLTREEFLGLYYKKKHSAFWDIPHKKYRERLLEIEEKTKGKNIIKCSSSTSLITMKKTST